MTITWINCAERMPPDDDNKVICKFLPPIKAPVRKVYGRNIWQFVEIRRTNKRSMAWTPYTEEAWSELTR